MDAVVNLKTAAEISALPLPAACAERDRLRAELRRIESGAPETQQGHGEVFAALRLAERRIAALRLP